MRLVRLLTAGKSLVGLENSQSRYQMSDPRAMPKFGSERNPFRASAKPSAARAESEQQETAVVPPASSNLDEASQAAASSSWKNLNAPGENALCAETESATTSTAQTGAPGVEMGKAVPAKSSHTGLISRLVTKAKSLVASRRTSPPRIQTNSRAGKAHVQVELSLDMIKVMRNDLRDADLEIAPAKQKAKRAEVGATETGSSRTDVNKPGDEMSQMAGAGKA